MTVVTLHHGVGGLFGYASDLRFQRSVLKDLAAVGVEDNANTIAVEG